MTGHKNQNYRKYLDKASIRLMYVLVSMNIFPTISNGISGIDQITLGNEVKAIVVDSKPGENATGNTDKLPSKKSSIHLSGTFNFKSNKT